jgi:hypothetical protein
VRRGTEHFLGTPELDELTQIHHPDPFSEMGYKPEIVGDEHVRNAKTVLDIR